MTAEDSIAEESKPFKPREGGPGTGMPASLLLDDFGQCVWDAFECDDHIAGVYLVGSALNGKVWRDVDVRVILDDETYAAMGFGDPKYPQQSSKWRALVLAFSALGRQMTGLPIDFQIQQMSAANAEYPSNKGHRRSALLRTDKIERPRPT